MSLRSLPIRIAGWRFALFHQRSQITSNTPFQLYIAMKDFFLVNIRKRVFLTFLISSKFSVFHSCFCFLHD